MVVATVLLAGFTSISAQARTWTIEDIVLAPQVTQLALSADGKTLAYAVVSADLSANRPVGSLRLVELETGLQREVVSATHIDQLRRIPGSADWSALLDVGSGLQLYRITSGGSVRELLVIEDPVLMGNTDQAVRTIANAPPLRVGVLAYDWSPDGKWLWYSTVRSNTGDLSSPSFNESVVEKRNDRHSEIAATIDFHVRGPGGDDVVVASAPTSDVLSLYYGANVVWQHDTVQFRLGSQSDTQAVTARTFAWNLHARTLQQVETTSLPASIVAWVGPGGGSLRTVGRGQAAELIEDLPGGNSRSFGPVAFRIGDPRSSGIHRSGDGATVIAGTRALDRPRYGLVVLGPDGMREIMLDDSLTSCSFMADLSKGACIREGLTRPPQIVSVDVERQTVAHVAAVSPHHEEIEPLRVESRQWSNRWGYRSTGHLIYPRNFAQGRRYPAIVVTHGSDADERFLSSDMQWNYPVQAFAEHGYFVLLINDPSPGQTDELAQAYDTWQRREGPTSPADMQRLLWLNGVHSFEDAVGELVAEGRVDPTRVGIAGYSRGSQMVNVSLTHSRAFRAGSSGDGSFLEPHLYPLLAPTYDVIFGGSPFGPAIESYRAFSPSLNADRSCSSLLQQMVAPRSGALDLHEAWVDAALPARLTLYPGAEPSSGETHIFHVPRNRMSAMKENLEWFDHWLKPDMVHGSRVTGQPDIANVTSASLPDRCTAAPDALDDHAGREDQKSTQASAAAKVSIR